MGCYPYSHFSYTALLQLLIVIALLINQIGYSALAAVAVVAVALPLQTFAMRKLFEGRQKSMIFTDARIKMISELLLGIKIVKMFAWEDPYVAKVHQLRDKELVGVRKLLTIRAGNQAVALSIPTLSAVVAFAVYAATGHDQSPAEIWTSISLLNLLRMPLMLLPNSLSVITDAYSALQRLMPVFLAEELPPIFERDDSAKYALSVEGASFAWESSTPPNIASAKKQKKYAGQRLTAEPVESEESPSTVEDITFHLERGQLLCICGPVGSGKSSLLQGLIGEMR
jgi:ABC-type multidrug transport system fused ATPase/permease subunit